ncbi:MAG: ATP-dependent Clp protease adapter ClpS [Kiritimatiellia bacterium]
MPRTATRTLPVTEALSRTEQEPLWNVIVWNDPVNLMNYVVLVFQRVFGYSRELATKLMLEVHNAGRSLVASEPREQAEMHVTQLHQYGLQATMQKQDA